MISEPYTLIRSGRKTLQMEIRPDLTLLIRAPKRTPVSRIEAFILSHEAWIAASREKARARQKSPMLRELTEAETTELYRRAQEELPPLVQKWASRMEVEPAGITITGAQKRFGSCSGKNRICFSFRLMQYPPEEIEYVVVHELAHIREHNHSPAFYNIVRACLPDYRERERRLREL